MKFDNIDRKILQALQNDGKLPNTELAKKINLSPSPCLTRVKRLESEGVIHKYVALLDPQKLDLRLNVFVFISLKAQTREALRDFESRICAYDEVMECYLMTGDADYLIRLAMTDIESLECFIVENLSPMPEIEKIRSSFALKQIRYKTALPLR